MSYVLYFSNAWTFLWPRLYATCMHASEIWNGFFVLFKTQQSPVILDLCLRKTRSRKSRDYRDVIILKKLPFPSTLKREPGVFKFIRSEESFRKAPFSTLVSLDGRLNLRNKAAFSNLSRIGWTRLYSAFALLRMLSGSLNALGIGSIILLTNIFLSFFFRVFRFHNLAKRVGRICLKCAVNFAVVTPWRLLR